MTLANRIADELAKVPGGLACETLARSLRRRTADVLAELRADPRFVATGAFRYRRWTLLVTDPEQARHGSPEGLERPARAEGGESATPALRGREIAHAERAA